MFRLFDNKVKKDSIQECYYLTHVENISSILQRGILSHRRVDKLQARTSCIDISNQEVQERRDQKVVQRVDENKKPLNLHRFVNLYLNPNNAMILAIYQNQGISSKDLCVLRISGEILNRGDVVVTDQNAATDMAHFYPSTNFFLNEDYTFCLSSQTAVGYKDVQHLSLFKWKDSEQISAIRKQIRQAEVLVPYQIHPSYIVGVFVSCDETLCKIKVILSKNQLREDLSITVHPSIFFQGKTDKLAPAGTTKSMPNISLQRFDQLSLHHELNTEYPESSDSEDEREHIIALIRT